MKNVNVIFQKNPDLDNITVTFSGAEMDEQICNLMELVRNSGGNEIFVQDKQNHYRRITLDQIIRVCTDRKVVAVSTTGEEYRLNRSLKDVETMLDDSSFLKISRFEIINLRRVRHFDFTLAGTLRIEFDDGTYTWASRRYIPVLKKRLSNEKEDL